MTRSCTCTINLPVLPGHVAYRRVKTYDGAGNFVQNGKSGWPWNPR